MTSGDCDAICLRRNALDCGLPGEYHAPRTMVFRGRAAEWNALDKNASVGEDGNGQVEASYRDTRGKRRCDADGVHRRGAARACRRAACACWLDIRLSMSRPQFIREQS